MHHFFTWPHVLIILAIVFLVIVVLSFATGGDFLEFLLIDDMFELIGELLSAW